MKKWVSEIFQKIFIPVFPYIVVFISSLFSSSDSDLGWHLKYGQFFFQNHAILKTNIFSSSMINYRWINSSWATDLLTYSVFSHFGFFGLSLLGALVITLILYFFAKAAKLGFWEKAIIFPFIIYLEEPLFIVSFRGQLLTLLCIAFIYYLFGKFHEGKRGTIFFTIPLFLLWSNFHGEYILGFCILASLFIFRILSMFSRKEKFFGQKIISEIKFTLLVLLLVFLASLINPYGAGTITETVRHFGNPLEKYIIEWLPFDTYSVYWWNLVVWGIFIFINLFVLYIKKDIRKNFHYIATLIILYALSFWMRRYNWPMYLISIPVVKHFLDMVRPKDEKVTVFTATLVFVSLYLYAVMVKNPNIQIQNMSWQKYCSSYVLCSPESAEYLVKNKPSGKLLTFYNWGGYLIWNYPEINPSIDGRMHLWRDNNGYSAFEKYYALEQDWNDIDKSEYSTVYFPPTKPLFKHMMKLVEEKRWKIVYQDKLAYIFEKIKNVTAE